MCCVCVDLDLDLELQLQLDLLLDNGQTVRVFGTDKEDETVDAVEVSTIGLDYYLGIGERGRRLLLSGRRRF